MSVKHIKKWLAELKSLPESAYEKYFETISFNKEVIEELYKVFNDLHSEKACQLIDPVCHQLFNCYKSNVLHIHKFALEFIPAIVWSYLTLLGSSSQQSGGTTAFLLGVYNLGSNEVSRSPLPSVFQGSIYHDPPFLSTTLLTESALKNRQSINGSATQSEISLKKFDSITSQNRSAVLGFAISVYLSSISNMSPRSHKTLCLLCSRLSRTGFEDKMEAISTIADKKFPIIPEDHMEKQRSFFEPPLIIELLFGMHFLMHSGPSKIALQALHDVHFRACYDLSPEILVVANAMLRHSRTEGVCLRTEPPGRDATAARFKARHSITKDAITNASFRAKKLPDDIDVQDESEKPSHSDTSFVSDGVEETHQEFEKTPTAKVNKLQFTKPLSKKDKSSKLQKSKENELMPGGLIKKLSSSIAHNSEHEGIQLKAIKPGNQDYKTSFEVSFKPKPNKLPYPSGDQKSAVPPTNPGVPLNCNGDVDDPFDASLETCSVDDDRLGRSTFL